MLMEQWIQDNAVLLTIRDFTLILCAFLANSHSYSFVSCLVSQMIPSLHKIKGRLLDRPVPMVFGVAKVNFRGVSMHKLFDNCLHH